MHNGNGPSTLVKEGSLLSFIQRLLQKRSLCDPGVVGVTAAHAAAQPRALCLAPLERPASCRDMLGATPFGDVDR